MAKRELKWRTIWFGAGLVVIGLGCLSAALISKDLLTMVGATMLGFIIGMLVSFFVQEEQKWNRSAMTASVVVLTGAGALSLLRYGIYDPQGVWFYPIGLVIGFGFGTIWEEVDPA